MRLSKEAFPLTTGNYCLRHYSEYDSTTWRIVIAM